MKAVGIDPRYATYIDYEPCYRVDFWTGNSACDEWLVDDVADVMEVLDWAKARANGRSIVIYSQTRGVDPVLACIYGTDPTLVESDESSAFIPVLPVEL